MYYLILITSIILIVFISHLQIQATNVSSETKFQDKTKKIIRLIIIAILYICCVISMYCLFKNIGLIVMIIISIIFGGFYGMLIMCDDWN